MEKGLLALRTLEDTKITYEREDCYEGIEETIAEIVLSVLKVSFSRGGIKSRACTNSN